MFAFCSIFKSRSATHPARLWNRTSPRPAPKSKPQFFRGVLEAGRVGERCNAFQRSHWVCAPSVAPPPRRIFPATGQGLERTAQAVQGQAINASHGACLIVWVCAECSGFALWCLCWRWKTPTHCGAAGCAPGARHTGSKESLVHPLPCRGWSARATWCLCRPSAGPTPPRASRQSAAGLEGRRRPPGSIRLELRRTMRATSASV